jgi:alpha-mannosidase
LRSPRSPDPTADRGKHSIEFALYPHKGTWRDAKTVRKGYEFNNPLLAQLTDVHKGNLPVQYSFVQISPSNLVLTSLKKSEDSDAWIVQWYDAEGKVSDGTVSFPRPLKSVVISNFLEEVGSPVPVQNNSVNVRTRASSIVTLRVTF